MSGSGLRVLVTGASGFLGQAFCRYLESVGVTAVGADRGPAPAPATSEQLDLADEHAVERLLSGVKPHYILHAAGATAVADEATLFETHVECTRVLLNSVRSACHDARVVVLGSAAEYGPPLSDAPIREGAVEVPTSPYGRSKLAQSGVARDLALQLGLDVVRVRLFNTIGPGQGPHLVAGAMVGRLRAAVEDPDPVFDIFDASSARDFLDVRDVARLAWRIARGLTNDKGAPPVQLATGKATTILGLGSALLRVAGVSDRVRVRTTYSRTAASVVGHPVTLLKLLGSEPLAGVPLEEGLRDMWLWKLGTH